MIAEVVFPILLRGSFDYQIPKELAQKSLVGYRVIAPWRSGYKEGIIVACKESSTILPPKLKDIFCVLDDFPLAEKQFISFTKWIAQYYFSSWGELLFFRIPSSIRVKTSSHPLFVNPLTKKLTESYYVLVKKEHSKNFRQKSKKQELFELFLQKSISSHKDVLQSFPKATPILSEFVKLGILAKKQRSVESITQDTVFTQDSPINLSEAQAQIARQCNSIGKKKFKIYLLHGVNASGKTAIYIHFIWQALRQGKSVLFLVPEIGMTPQNEQYIKEHFPNLVYVWHSRLGNKDKLAEWLKIRNSKTCIVLGTRSALFAPIDNLGLIVIDEEHDNSFRQTEHPIYNARDCACKLAQIQNITLVLGSATPSVASYRNAKLGKYHLLQLTKRYQDSVAPSIQIVDLKTAPKYQNIYYFSQILQQAIADNLANKKQTILFLNRRGFASLVVCQFCSEVMQCSRCSVHLTWHHSPKKLVCHYCFFEVSNSFSCQKCQRKNFSLLGIGTGKIEQLLKSVFPQARVLKLDSDSFANVTQLSTHLKKIQNNEVDLVIGTQIIAKGHHFPNVTLSCVLFADAGFSRSDYHSTESGFQLLVQVTGRAGREALQTGKTIIQSYLPNDKVLNYAIKQNFIDFYHYEIEKRKLLQQPPTTHWIMLRVCALIEKIAQKEVARLFLELQKKNWQQIELLGPIKATPYKLNNWFYWEIILQSSSLRILRQTITSSLLTSFTKYKSKIKVIVDP